MTKLDVIGQIADLKDIDYRNTLAISTLIELLIDKGVISRSDFIKKAHELEHATVDEIRGKRLNIKSSI